jgi:hypothetical protein
MESSRTKDNPYQVMPEQSAERREELKADIAEHGVLVALATSLARNSGAVKWR